jgi:amidase
MKDVFDVVDRSLSDLHAAIVSGAVSASGLTAAYLDRILAYDGGEAGVHALINVNEHALAAAAGLDRELARSGPRGPLHGIPIVIKDNIETYDLPTTGGCRALAGHRPERDATIVDRLRRAGAVILAKANLHEFALGGVTFSSLGGQTRNPYDPSRTPGGSSGGSAAAVAASFAAASIGTDTVNSIRSPASACGLVGLRPTHGLVSKEGIMPVCDEQDVVGPVARSVKDAAILLDVMANGAAGARPFAAAVEEATLSGARIGVLRTLLGAQERHREVNDIFSRALGVMEEGGAILVEVANRRFASPYLEDCNVWTLTFAPLIDRYLSERHAPYASIADIVKSGECLTDMLTPLLGMNRNEAAEELSARQQRRRGLKASLLGHMDDLRLDVVVYPLQKRLAVPIGEPVQLERNGVLAAVTGCPAITLPIGFSSPSASAPIGVPVGMDILARPNAEHGLLRIAGGFEKAAKIRRPPEGLPAL